MDLLYAAAYNVALQATAGSYHMLFLGRILLMGETAMADKLTELVFILDKSGSMAGLERDTIGGYNAMLEKQRRLAAKCSITTVIFAHDYVLLHDRQDINAVSPLTETEYYVGGTTALLDAIGQTIHKVTRRQEETAVDSKAHKVLFVIITDGEENASREYSAAQIRQMIEHHKQRTVGSLSSSERILMLSQLQPILALLPIARRTTMPTLQE